MGSCVVAGGPRRTPRRPSMGSCVLAEDPHRTPRYSLFLWHLTFHPRIIFLLLACGDVQNNGFLYVRVLWLYSPHLSPLPPKSLLCPQQSSSVFIIFRTPQTSDVRENAYDFLCLPYSRWQHPASSIFLKMAAFCSPSRLTNTPLCVGTVPLSACRNPVQITTHSEQCLKELWERLPQGRKAEGLYFRCVLCPGLFMDVISCLLC